jgi:hypothetical protein
MPDRQAPFIVMAGAQFGNKIVQQAAAAHTATVIFLHGLGDSGAGLANIGPAVRLPHVKVRWCLQELPVASPPSSIPSSPFPLPPSLSTWALAIANHLIFFPL